MSSGLSTIPPPPRAQLRVLVIEDCEDDAMLMLRLFRSAKYSTRHTIVDCAEDMAAALEREHWDVILADHSMPRFNATAALQLMQARGLDIPFIIVSGHIDEETAIAAMRAGAHDYLSKDKMDRLVPAVEREIREARNRAEHRVALEAVHESESRFRALATNLPGMVFQLLIEPGGSWRFLYVSEGSTALLNLRPFELIGKPERFLGLLFDADRVSLQRSLSLSAESGATVNWEGRIRLRDDEMKWINLRSSPRQLESGLPIWEGIVSNITQSKQVEAQLLANRQQLAELSSYLQVAVEEERARIARDIHDELGGILVGLRFEVALLSAKLPPERPDLLERMRRMESMCADAIATVSRVASELRPGILKEFGLQAALESHAEDFSARTGIACHMRCVDYDVELTEAASIALFRIFQEALNNTFKHAAASQVEVRFCRENNELLLEIADDGRGVAETDLSKPRSFGLRGMRERVASLGGRFHVERRAKGGTRISVHLPDEMSADTTGAQGSA
ncbi:MAG: response regulator [Rhodocyclaceae bacterium]|nr:response regulator [Rhodocyclaceae bacterium]MBX3668623.1 response regulator [Rhodocyclaceae bacterium]